LFSSLSFYACNSLQTIGQKALPAATCCHPYCPGVSFINPFKSLYFPRSQTCNIFNPFPFENQESLSFPLLPFTHQPVE